MKHDEGTNLQKNYKPFIYIIIFLFLLFADLKNESNIYDKNNSVNILFSYFIFMQVNSS